MAEKKTYADVLSEGKIGTYTESTGGGTPLKKGEKLKDHPEAHRVQQPRDEEGKFTYNSANAKELKYGPSRGTTVPPFLQNIKMTYAVKVGDRIVSEQGGKKHVYLSNLNFDADSLVKAFQRYDLQKGFGDFSKEIKQKKGALSNAEKAATSTSIIDASNPGAVLQNIRSHYTGQTRTYAVKKRATNQNFGNTAPSGTLNSTGAAQGTSVIKGSGGQTAPKQMSQKPGVAALFANIGKKKGAPTLNASVLGNLKAKFSNKTNNQP